LIVAIENAVATLAMLAMVVLPLVEIAVRRLFGVGVPASGPIVQHLTLWVGFLGAAIAAREGKLLALATGTFIPAGTPRRVADIFAAAVASCASLVLAWGGVQMVTAEREAQTTIGAGIPAWMAQAVLPVAFGMIALRLVWKAGPAWPHRLAASAGLAVAVVLIRAPGLAEGRAAWPGLIIVAIAAVLGMPLFAILRGAVLVFHRLHGRIRRNNFGAWGRAVSCADQGRVSRALRVGVVDRVRFARAAVASGAATHPLRRRRADSDRRHFHRRHSARP